MDPTVKKWRDDTPGCANRIHFNNAGAGLMPRGVLEAIIGHLETFLLELGAQQFPASAE